MYNHNKNVLELKFIRGIVCSIYGHKKVTIIDDCWYDNSKKDRDYDSLINICVSIKDKAYKLNRDTVTSIYSSVLPSVKKEPLNYQLLDELLQFISSAFELKDFLLFFVNKTIFGNLNFHMAAIIYCKWYYDRYNEFFIVSPEHERIIRKNACDLEKIDKVVCSIIKKNTEYKTLKKIFTIEKIKTIIENNSSYYKFFSIKKVYLFGSYAKGRNNGYSDIDLHVITNMKNYKIEQENELKKVFSNIFGSNVDVKINYIDEITKDDERYLFDREILMYEAK